MGNRGLGMRGARAYALVFGLLLAAAGVVEWSLLRSRYRSTMAYWEARQSSVADERAQRVSDWLRERQVDAQLFATRPSVRAALRSYQAGERLRGLRDAMPELTPVLDEMANLYPYAGVYVLGRDGRVVAQSSRSMPMSPALAENCRTALRAGAVRVDLAGDAPDQTLISWSAPVLPGAGAAEAGQPLGVTLLVLEAAQTLFPLVAREEVPTRTGETVLARRDGNDIVFFSPLRHVPAGSSNLRFPLARAPLPARAALEGREASLESADYRGVPVLTASRHIPLTGWGLVRKIDREEALAEFYRSAWTEGTAAGLLMLAFAGLLMAHRRHTMARVLRREEEKFRSLLESAPDAMVIVDRESRIVLVNAQAEWMFGFGRQKLVGQPIDILVPEWARARHHEGCRTFFAEPVAQHLGPDIEMRGLRQDGTEFPLEVRLNPIETVEGVWVACGIRDITQRKRAEEALRKSEEHFRSLFENMLNGFAHCQMLFENGRPSDFIYLDVNSTFENLTGLKDVVGKKVTEVIPGLRESNPELFEIYGRVASTGIPERFETYVGALKMWFSISVYSPRREHFVAVFEVITERKRAELQLAMQARIAEIFLTNPDEEMYNEVLKVILEVMRSPFGVFGYLDDTGSLVVPTMTRQVWDKCQVPEKTIRFQRETWGNSSWPCAIREKRVIYSNEPSKGIPEGHVGIERHISLPILFHGEVIGLFQVANKESDYTESDVRTLESIAGHVAPILGARLERERAEEVIRKLNEELEERVAQRTSELAAANKELEAFTYSVSHDLRAPLRHIDGFSRLLQEEHGKGLPAEAQRYVATIREATLQMGALIDDLLNLARVGRRALSVQVTGLNSLVEEVQRGLNHEAAGRRVEWRVGTLPFVECDPILVKQVFANLLSNAVKFTRPRDPAVIEVGADQQNGSPVIFVRDNGVGFSMKYADKLFGVFQRLHRTEDFEGTGVGLATVQRIIHKHGGQVWAEGELDKGATFYFTLGSCEAAPSDHPGDAGGRG